MTENYEQDYEPEGAKVITFPTRGEAGDDGLGVPAFVNAGNGGQEPGQAGPGLAESAVADHAIEGVVVNRGAGPTRAQRRIRKRRYRAKVRAVAGHPATAATGLHLRYIGSGARIAAVRTWESKTSTLHDRMMKAAHEAGDYEAALSWEERGRLARFERHERRMALLAAPVEIARGVLATVAGTAFLLLVAGIALWSNTDDFAQVATPFKIAADIVQFLVTVVEVGWRPAAYTAPFVVLATFWAMGRADVSELVWDAPAELENGEDRDMVPDESAILQALAALGIPALNKHFKNGWKPRWIEPAHLAGEGWGCQLLLPPEVPVFKIVEKKTTLAHNLLRAPVEVWPTEPRDKPGVMDLWVAHQGSLSGQVPPWPLLTDGTADFFKGVPIGITQRGEVVSGQLMGKNYMIGGIMGTGKSSLTRNLLLGAMLDVLTVIDVYVMAFNPDYDAMAPRLRTLVKGDDDEQIEAALKRLRELRDDVSARGKLLEQYGEIKLTRDVAEKDARLRPRIVVFDECHELFEHKKHGKEAAELAVKVMKKARKTGITLVFVTVSPAKDSIPKEVTRSTSNRAAFAVGDYIANDGILGTGKYKAGITATELDPNEDIGTAVTIGFTRNRFELVRMNYVAKEGSLDEITPVVVRALALLNASGVEQPETAAEPDPDLLAEVADILAGADRMLCSAVIAALAARYPSVWGELTPAGFKEAMDAAGAPTYKTEGRMHVSAERVAQALADRDDEPDDGFDDDVDEDDD